MKRNLENALFIIHNKLKGKKIKWRIGGGTNLILWGINVPSNDVDIITTKTGAYDIERLLKKYVVKPVEFSETDKFSSHFGKFKIKGIEVEVMGDLKVKVSGKWRKSSLRATNVSHLIKSKKLIFPLNDLKQHMNAYQRINREKDLEKIRLIKEFLESKKRLK
ncbi:MAG: hypothetical protein WC796_03255 [Candidatus Pacearchaeota archaeon]|jgi:hypothetical protein